MIEHVFRVYGIPAPQGSKRPVKNRKTGKVNLIEQSKALPGWRTAVKDAAVAYRQLHNVETILEPVLLGGTIFVPRPKTVKRAWPAIPPDLDKIVRGIGDAISESGLWKDDAQVVGFNELLKVYAGDEVESAPGALIRLTVLV